MADQTPTAEKDTPDHEKAYRQAVGDTELAGSDYEAAIGSKDPQRIRSARAAFNAAADREHQALTAWVESRRPTFAQLLNDPAQQLDSEGIIFQRVLAADTSCACTVPTCPRHLRPETSVLPPAEGHDWKCPSCFDGLPCEFRPSRPIPPGDGRA